jgi:hypothetical protein
MRSRLLGPRASAQAVRPRGAVVVQLGLSCTAAVPGYQQNPEALRRWKAGEYPGIREQAAR